MTRLQFARLGLHLVPVGLAAMVFVQHGRWNAESCTVGRQPDGGALDRLVLWHGDRVNALAFSADGAHLATAGGVLLDTGDVKVWELEHGRVRAAFRSLHRWVTAVAFLGDQHTLVSVNSRMAHRCRDDAPVTLEALFCFRRTPAKVAVAPNGETLAYTDLEGRLQLIEVPSGRERVLSGVPDRNWYSVAFSPDGRSVAAAGSGQVKVWDMATGLERFSQRWPDDATSYAVALSPDGRSLAHVLANSTVRVLEIPSGRERAILSGHADWVVCLAYSPDGRHVVSGGRDGRVILWNVADGHEQARMERHAEPVNCLAFSPDSRRLATGSDDGCVCVWRVGATH